MNRFRRFGRWLALALALLGLDAAAAPATTPAATKPPRGIVYTLDVRPLHRLPLNVGTNATRIWDTMHCLAALQGLANRDRPSLYLLCCSDFGTETDQFWLDWLRTEDGWLRETELRPLKDLEGAVGVFRQAFKGLVVYDPAVPATASLASTAAGCESLLPVRFDPAPGSVYDLLKRKLELPVKLWLVNPDGTSRFTGKGQLPAPGQRSSRSAKVDAYRWARDRYLRPGGCAPGIAAYYLDAFWLAHPAQADPTMHTLPNHDYFISRRAFFFDLSPWGDETPNDDPSQPLGADRRELLAIMRAIYDRNPGGMIQLGGFPPWPYKYTLHAKPPNRHDGVPTEWEFGRLISQFNGYMEADAAGPGAIANASFYRHYPLAKRYPQPNRKPTLADWRARGYVTRDGKVEPRLFVGHYVGDYDAPSWLYKAVPAFFRDPARGQVPLGWAFNPNLAERAPMALVYARRHATTNDFFIAGDSGAGYLNPRSLTLRSESGLPSGLASWTSHCRRYYERWDLSITGFILDGSGGASTAREFEAYRSFSPDGAGTHFEPGPAMRSGLATCPERDLPDEVNAAARFIVKTAEDRGAHPGFLWARSILKSPRWYAELSRQLLKSRPVGDIVIVDPYTFFGLLALDLANRGR